MQGTRLHARLSSEVVECHLLEALQPSRVCLAARVQRSILRAAACQQHPRECELLIACLLHNWVFLQHKCAADDR